MTIQREHFDGPITFVCDRCGEADATHCENFGGAMAKFKAHGGVAVHVGLEGDEDEWAHYCRGCAK